MIRVVFVSHDCGLGGAERSLLDLLRSLDKQEFTPIVLLPCGGELKFQLDQLGIPTRTPSIGHWIAPPGYWRFGTVLQFFLAAPRRIRSLIGLIRQYEPDVVYTNTSTVIDAAIAARLLGKKHIWHLHEDFSPQGHVRPFLNQALTNALIRILPTLIVVNSEALKQQFVGSRTLQNVRVIYNGVDVSAFEAADSIRESLTRENGLDRDAILIGHVGGLNENKDQVTMLRALASLKKTGINANCIFVGTGNEKQALMLRKEADLCGVLNQSFFLGQRDDIPQLMKSIDMLAVSSRKEAFGRVIIEAMAAGKPVVATRSGGPSEIIVHGETGFLVPVGSADQMAEKLALLGRDRTLASQLGTAGKRRVDERFRLELYVAQVQDAIVQAVQN